MLIFKSIAQKYGPSLSLGSHSLKISWRYKNKITQKTLPFLRLAHFPLRSLDQLKSKVFVSQINGLSRIDLKEGQSFHIRNLYEKLKKDPQNVSCRDLQRFVADSYFPGINLACFSLKYDPLTLPFSTSLDIKYTKFNEINYLENVLENCTILAKQYANLKREKYSLTKTAISLLSVINGLAKQLITKRILGFNRDLDKYQL